MFNRRDFATQIVDSGERLGGHTGTTLMFAGAFVGVVLGILQLTLLALFLSIFVGSVVWWFYYAALIFIGYRFVKTLIAHRGKHREENRVGRHTAGE